MTVSELAQRCGFAFAVRSGERKEVTGGFCGDLLSWAIGRAKTGDAWVTVIGNANTVAVALLAGVSCIVLSQGAELMPEAAERAEENDLAVLKSGAGSFENAASIARALSE